MLTNLHDQSYGYHDAMCTSSPGSSANSPANQSHSSTYIPSFLTGEPNSANSFGKHKSSGGSSPGRVHFASTTKRSYPSPYASRSPDNNSSLMTSPNRHRRLSSTSLVPVPEKKLAGPPLHSLSSNTGCSDAPSINTTSHEPAYQFGTPLINRHTSGVFPVSSPSYSFSLQSDAQPGVNDRDLWVTVFGFTGASASYVLQQFSQYGKIVEHKIAPNGNWMDIKYSNSLQATKALSKNGKVYCNSVMVGVKPRENTPVSGKENLSSSCITGSAPQNILTPQSPLVSRRVGFRQPEFRSDHLSPGFDMSYVGTPQKSTGVLASAMEYLFGW